MSKSLGNYVGITQEPKEMFGRILSISDTLMWRYYELLSTKTLQEIGALKIGVEQGKIPSKSHKRGFSLRNYCTLS